MADEFDGTLDYNERAAVRPEEFEPTTPCEHRWEEQPGEPPIDVCFHCGEVRE